MIVEKFILVLGHMFFASVSQLFLKRNLSIFWFQFMFYAILRKKI